MQHQGHIAGLSPVRCCMSHRKPGSITSSCGCVQAEGLTVTDVVVLIDREQGGPARLASQGLRLHSAFTLRSILKVLVAHGLVSAQVEASVKAFLASNQTFKGTGNGTAPRPAPAPRR